jgi:hypothetical protein
MVELPAQPTPRALRILSQAADEAKAAGVNAIGVEHMVLAILSPCHPQSLPSSVLAILKEPGSIPRQVLHRLRVTARVRIEMEAILNSEGYRVDERGA